MSLWHRLQAASIWGALLLAAGGMGLLFVHGAATHVEVLRRQDCSRPWPAHRADRLKEICDER